MRARLITVFLAPLVCVLLVLGGAYAWSSARSIQQEFASRQADDLAYFLTAARQALRAENISVVDGEMRRYAELYGARIAMVDRGGNQWVFGGEASALAPEEVARVELALSGRRSEPLNAALPWVFDEVTVEPVFDDGRVIGAVLIAASPEAPKSRIVARWTLLIGLLIGVVLLLGFVVVRVANWVLAPLKRVDRAMAAIEHGDMDARIDDDTGPPEMRRMIRIFNSMAEEIERVVSHHQEFVLNASHELRNPIGALLLRVESLAANLGDDSAADVEEVRAAGRRITRLLDTLLSLARADRRDARFVPVDLVELVAGRLNAWRDVVEAGRVFFMLDGERTLLHPTDRTAFESAFDAVLGNAVKFAPEDSLVEVRVEADDDECRVSVRDHGRGLPPEEMERAMDRFWRSPRDRGVQGSGLGLAIAADLLESLGGGVRLSAPETGGLRVTLFLRHEAAS